MADNTKTAIALEELVTAIRTYPDPRRAAAEWKAVYKLLQQTDLPAIRVTNVVAGRDMVRLAELIGQLVTPSAPPPDAPDAETCRQALKAFRKRLSLTRLDDESRLGRSPLSKGEGSGIKAISPPVEWPEAVWQELARQGRLKSMGHGLYEFIA